jgi:hypothetical protein
VSDYDKAFYRKSSSTLVVLQHENSAAYIKNYKKNYGSFDSKELYFT